MKIILSIFSDHNGKKLEINTRGSWRICKCVDTKQHSPEQPVGQRRHQKGNKKYLETNENGNTMYQNLWDAAKEVLKRFIAINTYIKKWERSLITT